MDKTIIICLADYIKRLINKWLKKKTGTCSPTGSCPKKRGKVMNRIILSIYIVTYLFIKVKIHIVF